MTSKFDPQLSFLIDSISGNVQADGDQLMESLGESRFLGLSQYPRKLVPGKSQN